MEIGKISNRELINRVFKNIKYTRDEVLVKSSVGMDTSVLDLGEDLVVVSCDPITGASKDIGKLAVHISCNDVACECADPVGILMSILLPPTASLEELEQIVSDANEECKALNLDIVGGHTEVTDAVTKIVVTTTVIGRSKRTQLPQRHKILVGDVIVLSKEISVEGTSIIVNEKEEELKKILTDEEIQQAKELSQDLSVLPESKIARKYNVKQLHDITEGGVYGALWETAQAIGKGIRIDALKIPVLDLTRKICNYFKINPYRLISSGSMIMVFSSEDYSAFKKECKEKNIPVTVVGEVIEGHDVILSQNGVETLLEEPGTDELYKVV
ncbi:MAG: AIR synthase family protein [Tissierellia bacterium]|nr:AIR synthase family protein [Tissierellia bacterium]